MEEYVSFTAEGRAREHVTPSRAGSDVRTMTAQLSIGVLAEKRYLAQAQPRGLLDALGTRDVAVTLVDPGSVGHDLAEPGWLEPLDLIVARGRSWSLLALLGWAEGRGVATINRRAAIASVHNKAEMSIRLALEGLPVPRTWFGALDAIGAEIPRDAYPVILKPIFGDNCRGLVIAHSPDELAAVEWPEPVALVQPFLPTDGYDVKLYGIGHDVWAVRKPSPLDVPDRPAGSGGSELLAATPELEALGRRCGELFGLELFGVDCIVTADGPHVIEVNDYPNFTAVPYADARLADYVAARAGEERRG